MPENSGKPIGLGGVRSAEGELAYVDDGRTVRGSLPVSRIQEDESFVADIGQAFAQFGDQRIVMRQYALQAVDRIAQ